MASKRMRKPEAKSARIASKSNSVFISARYCVTGSTISTVASSSVDGAQPVDVDVGRVRDVVGVDRLGAGENRVGDLLRRRAAGADVVFDAEIAVRSARIVARRQDDAAERAEMADEGRGGRGRQDSALADHDPAEAVGGGDFDHDLDRLAIVEAAVATEDQRLALKSLERIEDRLDEILEIARLPGRPAPSCAGPKCRASDRGTALLRRCGSWDGVSPFGARSRRRFSLGASARPRQRRILP